MKKIRLLVIVFLSVGLASAAHAAEITTLGRPAQLDIRVAGAHCIRVTLRPLTFDDTFPFTPALAERAYAAPVISLRPWTVPSDGKWDR